MDFFHFNIGELIEKRPHNANALNIAPLTSPIVQS